METSISGAEVPRETIVSPMIAGARPRLAAMDAAPATNRSALRTSTAKAAIAVSRGISMRGAGE